MSAYTLILSLVRPFFKHAMVLFLLLLLSAVVETMSLGMVFPFLQKILNTSSDFGIMIPWLGQIEQHVSKDFQVIFLAILILTLMVIREVLILLRAYMEAKFSGVLRTYWASTIMKNYLKAPYAYIRKQKQGVLLNNIIRETLESSKGLKDLVDLLAKIILVFALIIMLFAFNPFVTFLSLVMGFLFMAAQWKLSSRLSLDIGKKRMQCNQILTANVTECLSGLRQVKTFALEKMMYDTFFSNVQTLEKVKIKLNVIKVLPRSFGNGLVFILLMAGMIICVKGFSIPLIEIIPLAGVFFATAQRLFINLSGILSLRVTFLSTLPSIKLVHRLVNEKLLEKEFFGSKKFETFRHSILFDQVVFEYVPGKPVFNSLTLEIRKNMFIGIVGPSGSGKSTVCDLLAGFYNPVSGKIMVDDTPLHEFSLSGWRGRLGYVSQDPFLFNASIYDNILCGQRDASSDEVLRVAKQAGVDEFVAAMTDGYNAKLNQNADQLSGGQRQKIAIARALLRNPEVMIFDEATSALDAQSEQMILDIALSLRDKTTVVWISHKLNTMRQADCVYVLEEGNLVQTGKYQDLLQEEGLFKALIKSGNAS